MKIVTKSTLSKRKFSCNSDRIVLLEKKVQDILLELGSVVVAYSGGVDSALLLKMASDVLKDKDKVLAVTAISLTYPASEMNEAKAVAVSIGARHIFVDSAELFDENFVRNDERRCYYCKNELFSLLDRIADESGFDFIVDGSNADDLGDYRPGLEACSEMGVRSPFIEAGVGKEDIRELSQKYNLSTWDKPAQACLSSRVPYGTEITGERLTAIYQGELVLKKMGFTHCRLRYHGEIARIEIPEDRLDEILDPGVRGVIILRLKELGFKYITIDMDGYRTGSMNEVLDQ